MDKEHLTHNERIYRASMRTILICRISVVISLIAIGISLYKRFA